MHTIEAQSATQMYKFNTKPYKHQYTVWNDSKDKKEYAFFMEMGTGKSKVAIDTFSWLYDQGKIESVLIICPKGAYHNWYNKEIPIHLPEHIRHNMVLWTSYQNNFQKREIESLKIHTEDLRILIINVEAVATRRAFKVAKFLVDHSKCMIIVDESTTIKNGQAARTKATYKLGMQATYKRILSGQPIANSPIDLYSQMNFLGDYILGFSSFYSFRNRYAIVQKMNLGNRSFNKIVGFQRLDELEKMLKPYSSRIRKSECLDLPDKVYETRQVFMPKEQEKLYKQMKEQARISIEEEDCSAVNILAQLIKLHQISCGHVISDNGEVLRIENFRINELLNVVDSVPGKIIVWATYRADIKLISEILQQEYGHKSVVEYYGETKDTIRAQNIEAFQGGKDTRFFVGNPQTGGMGITLTASSTVVYYSNSYNLEHRIQSEDRAHRIGQINKVTYIDLICPKTVDEKIVKALRSKKQLAGQILGDEWQSWI